MKTYLKPEIEAVEIETVDIICTSLEIGGNNGVGSEESTGSDDGIVEW